MSSRRHTPEQIINKLRQAEVEVATDIQHLGASYPPRWHDAGYLLSPPAPGAPLFPYYQARRSLPGGEGTILGHDSEPDQSTADRLPNPGRGNRPPEALSANGDA